MLIASSKSGSHSAYNARIDTPGIIIAPCFCIIIIPRYIALLDLLLAVGVDSFGSVMLQLLESVFPIAQRCTRGLLLLGALGALKEHRAHGR